MKLTAIRARRCELFLNPTLFSWRWAALLDVVLKVPKHFLTLALKLQAKRRAKHPAENSASLEGRFDGNSRAVVAERGDLPAIPGIGHEWRHSSTNVCERPTGIVVCNDRFLDIGKHP